MPGALVLLVGLKGVNNWCSSWNSLVLGGTILGEENASYISSLIVEVTKEEEVLLVVVCGIVVVADWQLLTMAKRSQSSAIMQRERKAERDFWVRLWIKEDKKIKISVVFLFFSQLKQQSFGTEGGNKAQKMALTFRVNGKI